MGSRYSTTVLEELLKKLMVAILWTEHYPIYAFLIELAEYDLWKISSVAYFPIHFIMIL